MDLTTSTSPARLDIIAALKGMTGWNDFAASLVAQYERKRRLSEKQWDAAQRMLTKMDRNRARREELACEVDVSAIAGMLGKAKQKLKRPKFHAAGLSFSFAPDHGINAGAVYVKMDGDYRGKIKDGMFQPAGEPDEAVARAVVAVASDPLGEAIKHGHLTGRCSCCNRLLSDDTNKGADGKTSIERGVGPVCAERFGLL